MKPVLTFLTIAFLAIHPAAADHHEQPEALPLWPGGAPGALGDAPHDVPSIQAYLPQGATAKTAAVVICPGGGYGGLAPHEGHDYALWLNRHGIASFVLKYRLGSKGYRHPIMINDVARAVRLVRARADEWKVDASRVGIMGSSAGGHLASTLLTHFDAGNPNAPDPIDKQSSRPDLGILCYPVISMGPWSHGGSRKNLLGDKPDKKLIWELSNELQVTAETPPTFIWHTAEDTAVPVENSLYFAAALQKAGVPVDLHVYMNGRHGIGLADDHPWTKDLLFFLQERGFAERAWMNLFYNNHLKDANAPAGVWTVNGEGVLTASEDEAIWTKQPYDNFIIDLEFQTADSTNSGIIVYCSDTKNWIPNSVEIQIADDHSEQWSKAEKTWKNAAFFGHQAVEKSTVKKPGEWNHYTITCQDSIITVVLNGEKVNEMDLRKWTSSKTNPDGSAIPDWLSKPKSELPTKGYIGLQGKHAGAPIYFRNVKLKVLD
ncbi:MAG: acetyl esterase/lipase [Verrucomicrobiales bacterium]|jgi:acetyl esterase/lipase